MGARLLVGAQSNGSSANGSTLSPELAAFLASQPKWSVSTAVEASYGHKDNVLLSPKAQEEGSVVAPEDSAFARGGVEVLLLRLPQDRFDFSFFAQGERTHYFSAIQADDRTIDHDAKVWLQTEPAYRLTDALRLALPVTGFYYDQVFDVSDTEIERNVAELTVKGAMVGPLVRWDFHPSWWIEAQGVGQRKRYDDQANDARIGDGVVRLGWVRGSWLEVRVTGARRWHNFDHREQYASSGVPQADTKLKVDERETELRFDITWDDAGRWETSTRASLLHYRDNGTGYFNYREQKIAHELEWRGDRWRARIGGSAGRLDFSVQKGETGINARQRFKDEFAGELYVERKVSARWSVFGNYLWERTRSNDDRASYKVNEGLLGARWSWEK